MALEILYQRARERVCWVDGGKQEHGEGKALPHSTDVGKFITDLAVVNAKIRWSNDPRRRQTTKRRRDVDETLILWAAACAGQPSERRGLSGARPQAPRIGGPIGSLRFGWASVFDKKRPQGTR